MRHKTRRSISYRDVSILSRKATILLAAARVTCHLLGVIRDTTRQPINLPLTRKKLRGTRCRVLCARTHNSQHRSVLRVFGVFAGLVIYVNLYKSRHLRSRDRCQLLSTAASNKTGNICGYSLRRILRVKDRNHGKRVS